MSGRAAFLALLLVSPLRAQIEEDPADAIFERGEVVRLQIEIPPPEIKKLRADPRSYVMADVRDGSVRLQKLGLSLKGSAGSFRDLDDKPGLTLKANQFVPEQRFRGLRKVYLQNGVQDPSYLCELIAYDLFRRAGIAAPRVGHALVELNGRDLGLYVLVEGITRDFLARHFESPHGALFDGPGDILDDIDEDARGIFVDGADIEALRSALREPDPRGRLRRMREVLDLDAFARFVALEALIHHWDGYALAANNYRLYHDPSRGRMEFIPAGADQVFQEPSFAVFPDMQAGLARALVETPEGRRLYREKVGELLSLVLDRGPVMGRARAVSARLHDALARRPRDEREDRARAAAELIERIGERCDRAFAQVIGIE